MTDFKVGDEVVFKDGHGQGQHWAVPHMVGTVVSTNCVIPGNIRVSVIFGSTGKTMVGEFRPKRWQLLEKPATPTLEDARRLVELSEQIADKTQDIAAKQAELQEAEVEYKKLAEKLGIQ